MPWRSSPDSMGTKRKKNCLPTNYCTRTRIKRCNQVGRFTWAANWSGRDMGQNNRTSQQWTASNCAGLFLHHFADYFLLVALTNSFAVDTSCQLSQQKFLHTSPARRASVFYCFLVFIHSFAVFVFFFLSYFRDNSDSMIHMSVFLFWLVVQFILGRNDSTDRHNKNVQKTKWKLVWSELSWINFYYRECRDTESKHSLKKKKNENKL